MAKNIVTNILNNMKTNDEHTNKVIDEVTETLENPKARIANGLSLSRIPLGLITPLTAYMTKNQYLTLGLAGLYSITDFLDGFVAKKIYNNPTEGGKYIDAVCDKIGAMEMIIPAILQNPYILINGALEGMIAKINAESFNNGNDVNSNMLGKIKMWPLSLEIIATYMSITGLEIGKLKISKNTFKKVSLALIPITAALEIINIKQYQDIANNQNKQKSLEKF